ncbi:hypothetical protein SteCoe_9328 [Stentor coeruleus]|uniref:Uncharacterized protein n=1 Tax=Stentor coeruleus TaxID=5963 RepID=A0A1R2CI39_9CILI|nr:hypothetical protein SteCoe_9328 [Stentor coeruleus]
MRPTELQFRNPKEKTSEFNMPVVTKEGKVLLVAVCENDKPNFAKSKRFPQYEDYAKYTGYRVGPGSYCTNNTAIGRARVKGTHLYRGFHGNKDVTNNGYIYVGHQMIFDRSFILPSRKSPLKEIKTPTSAVLSINNTTFQRFSTASTPGRHRRSDSSKPRMMSPSIASYSNY